MSCALCNVEFTETDRRSNAPCCERVFHSQCLIDAVCRFFELQWEYDGTGTLHCQCGHVHFQRTYHQNNDVDETFTELYLRVQENPQMKEAIKNMKKRFAESNRSYQRLKEVVKTESEHFKDGAQLHINALKNIKAASMKKIKESNEYKTTLRQQSATNMMLTLFKRRYNIGWRETQFLFPNASRYGHRRRYHWHTPTWMVARKFRVRL